MLHDNVNIIDCSDSLSRNRVVLKCNSFDCQVSICVRKKHIQVTSDSNIFSTFPPHARPVHNEQVPTAEERHTDVVVGGENGSMFMNSAGELYQVQEVAGNRVTARRVDFGTSAGASGDTTIELSRNECATLINQYMNPIS